MPLTTLFSQNKSASLLTKNNTFSHKPTTTEQPTLVRSNTFSKVKRLGSLLVRNNKKSSPPRVDTIFPSPIDTSLASSYSLSSSCTHTHSSSDEDELMTPKDMTFQPLSPTVIEESVTPELQTNQIQESTSIKGEQQQQIILSASTALVDTSSQEESIELDTSLPILSTSPEIIDPLTLSGVSLVRYHLNLALEIADKEIEQELESHHVQMLHSISIIPSIVY